MRVYQMDAAEVAEQLNSDIENGCNPVIVTEKTGVFSSARKTITGVLGLHRSKFYYVNVVVLICYAIAVVFSCLNGSWNLFGITLASIFVTLILNFAEGYFLYRYREAYYARIANSKQSVAVIRNGKRVQVSSDQLVLGDLISLDSGVILHADARIISSNDLFADENFVFGSTIPAEKSCLPIEQDNLPPEKQKNMLWKGSNITYGSGLAMITALGADCYVEKTGGRKAKKQRSFFYNKQNNIGHIVSYIFVIFLAVSLLIGIIFTNRYVEAFLLMGVMSSLIMLNPVSCLMEWTFYRTAAKLHKQGALIRNIEAFDGMNKEKDVYFDANGLLRNVVTYSHTIDLLGDEKSSLSYFALCLGKCYLTDAMHSALERYNLSYDQLDHNYPVFRREKDPSENAFSVFSKSGSSIAVSVGYWQKMLPLIKHIDQELLDRIRELEHHGKMVYMLASDMMSFIPSKLDFDYFSGHMEVASLIVFDVPVDQETLSMISQLRRASMRVHLIFEGSEELGSAIAASYDMDDLISFPLQKRCYTLPHLKEQNLVAFENASPIEKERAMMVLDSSMAPHKVIYHVKCMFCGIRRCLNFLAISGFFLLLSVFVMFLTGASIESIIIPSLVFKIILLCPCYYLVESVRNCNQHKRSLILGSFCGVVGFVAALVRCDIALLTVEFSMLLIAGYLLISSAKFRKIHKIDFILLACASIITVFFGIFIGGDWLAAFLLAIFPPIATFILDLFY